MIREIWGRFQLPIGLLSWVHWQRGYLEIYEKLRLFGGMWVLIIIESKKFSLFSIFFHGPHSPWSKPFTIWIWSIWIYISQNGHPCLPQLAVTDLFCFHNNTNLNTNQNSVHIYFVFNSNYLHALDINILDVLHFGFFHPYQFIVYN